MNLNRSVYISFKLVHRYIKTISLFQLYLYYYYSKEKSADWKGLCDYFSVFPWDATFFSNKNVSEACDDITKVIQYAMKAYIPHTYRILRSSGNQWFNIFCNLVGKCKIKAHKIFYGTYNQQSQREV